MRKASRAAGPGTRRPLLRLIASPGCQPGAVSLAQRLGGKTVGYNTLYPQEEERMATYIATGSTLLEGNHQFDDRTAYCTRCGCHWNTAYLSRRGCVDAPNVTAISHLRARARLDALLALRHQRQTPQKV